MYNCIGVNNHRHFFLYLINMTLGVVTFDWIVYYCNLTPTQCHYIPRQLLTNLDLVSLSSQSSDSCNILSPALCKVVNADAYTLIVAIWATLQLTWVSMLLFVQFIQVSRAMTTYENMFGIDYQSTGAIHSAFTSAMLYMIRDLRSHRTRAMNDLPVPMTSASMPPAIDLSSLHVSIQNAVQSWLGFTLISVPGIGMDLFWASLCWSGSRPSKSQHSLYSSSAGLCG